MHDKPGKSPVGLLVGTIVSIVFLYCLDIFTVGRIARPVPFPFTDNECLNYEISYPNSNNPGTNSKVCFRKKGDNFIERVSGVPWLSEVLTTTFNLDGFSILSKEDIEYRMKAFSRDKNLPLFLQQEEKRVMKGMKEHCRYFGPLDLEAGDLFYNKFPVKEFSEYNNEPVYLVEVYPWRDTQYADKGLVSKFIQKLWLFSIRRRQQFIMGYPKRTKSSSDVMERLYYSRKSGVLMGSERLWVVRDVKGNVVSEDSSKKERDVKTRLIRQK
ncbi:MAG: hypothetical protein Q8L26_01840 [Candidatus Omnitrophota bacterium]|nr:hypothetical protein [Candidatus Omnitrophota bacterium]